MGPKHSHILFTAAQAINLHNLRTDHRVRPPNGTRGTSPIYNFGELGSVSINQTNIWNGAPPVLFLKPLTFPVSPFLPSYLLRSISSLLSAPSFSPFHFPPFPILGPTFFPIILSLFFLFSIIPFPILSYPFPPSFLSSASVSSSSPPTSNIGPIPWGHSGPLCHALSLSLSSSSSWTSMRRRRATVAAVATPGE